MHFISSSYLHKNLAWYVLLLFPLFYKEIEKEETKPRSV